MADCAHDADVDADGVGVVIALKQFLFIYYKLPFMSPCHLQKPRGQRAVQPCWPLSYPVIIRRIHNSHKIFAFAFILENISWPREIIQNV